jgi:putative SOS response-associated peptidase YedK
VCGRFNQTASGEEVAEAFGLDAVPELAPRYNIAPTQKVAVVSLDPASGRRGLAQLTWGLVPRDALGRERGFINARAETAADKPAFSEAFARRRCLIPATGFYEWQKLDARRRQPWLIRLAAPGPFAFAGLWEPAAAVPGATPTCTILTTAPNEIARPIHDRMPVILAPADYALWLGPALTLATELRPLLRPYPAAAMTAYPVGTRVNNPAFDDPGCLEPA